MTSPSQSSVGTQRVKRGLAEMLKGGVIMDVVTPEQARIAEDAGACAVMALERVPADIRRDGGVARMSDPEMIEGIKAAVRIPVMAKARIGHFVEAQILEALGVDFVDESEVLTPADETHHIDKFAFTVPFVCGATNLGEALRRVSEGACMIRSKGEAGTGNIVEAVRHLRSILGDIRRVTQADNAELFDWAKKLQAPLPLVQEIAETGRFPVPIFCAGGIATPADAALAMQLGAEAVFVGSGIFKSEQSTVALRAKAIVEATTHFRDPDILAKVSRGLGAPMTGIGMDEINQRYAEHARWRVEHDVAAARVVRSVRRGLREDRGGHARLRDLCGDDPPRLRGARRARRPEVLRRDRHLRAQERLRPAGRLIRGGYRHGGGFLPRGLHPRPPHRAGRARGRDHRVAARRACPRAQRQRAGRLVPPRARGGRPPARVLCLRRRPGPG